MAETIKADWFSILKTIRKLTHKGERGITSADLAGTSLFHGYADERAKTNIAGAWMDKFCRWGYLKRAGSIAGETRWRRVFKITKYGLERPEPKKEKPKV